MNNQVLSIEQMRELIDMGVDVSKASLYWYATDESEFVCFGTDIDKDWGDEICPTFTLQDILELLPDSIVDKDGYTRIQMILPQDNKEVIIAYDNVKQFSGSWLKVAFNMLKWVKQNNYI